jgi:acetylornithine/succinyldiaminopimelate/putrescine aminotransferase
MLSSRQLFLQHIGQTSDLPLMLEIESAEGIWLFSPDGRKYADLISGVSVSNIGHRHPHVIQAIKNQLDKHMHLMVYGEYIQAPQVKLAKLLADNLPSELNCTYFVNSGSEAIEGALKLAKRDTGRAEIIAFRNAYHGSTQGALSVMGGEEYKNSFRPLLPAITFLEFNNRSDLGKINTDAACVIIEPIQGEAGVRMPHDGFLKALREKCSETGTLLILDEIQTGFGRTGQLFSFRDWRIEPDILVLAKSLGGGLPLGAFISSREILSAFKTNPVLGHITTFGGNPVSCAAGLASLEVLLKGDIISQVIGKEQLFRENLVHPLIIEIRGKGLLLAMETGDKEITGRVIRKGLENGIVLDNFLFCDTAMRISPPLTITKDEILEVCRMLRETLENVSRES